MTRVALLLGALAAVVVAVGAVAWLMPPSEEDEVLAPLRRLVQAAGTEAGAPRRMGADRGTRLAAFLTPEAVVDLGPPLAPAAGRDALIAAAAALPVPAGGLEIALLEADVSVDRRLLLANATVTVQATTADGREVLAERTYEVALRRRDGVWLIHALGPAPPAASRP